MNAAQALADLTEISSQVETVVLAGDDGAVLAANVDEAEAERVAAGAARLLEQAATAVPDRDAQPVQLEVATAHGSVFVVREGGRTIAATTAPEPTVGLVLYDLKSCLRALDAPADERPKPKPRASRKKKEQPDGAA